MPQSRVLDGAVAPTYSRRSAALTLVTFANPGRGPQLHPVTPPPHRLRMPPRCHDRRRSARRTGRVRPLDGGRLRADRGSEPVAGCAAPLHAAPDLACVVVHGRAMDNVAKLESIWACRNLLDDRA